MPLRFEPVEVGLALAKARGQLRVGGGGLLGGPVRQEIDGRLVISDAPVDAGGHDFRSPPRAETSRSIAARPCQ